MICSLEEKDTRYLSDVLKYFNRLTNQNVKIAFQPLRKLTFRMVAHFQLRIA